jgi:hypothetical protein
VEFLSTFYCTSRGNTLVHVHAVVGGAATWSRVRTGFAGLRGVLTSATVAVRDQRTGKPLAYAEIDSAGATKLWTAARCR